MGPDNKELPPGETLFSPVEKKRRGRRGTCKINNLPGTILPYFPLANCQQNTPYLPDNLPDNFYLTKK
jgi:hypothetical protein